MKSVDMNKSPKVKLIKLPTQRWRDYKSLRLRALKEEPFAFGTSYEEEKNKVDKFWIAQRVSYGKN